MNNMYQKKMLIKYAIAMLIGIVVGFKVIPPLFAAIIFLGAIVLCCIYMLQGNIEKTFLLLPYIVYSEIFVRGHVRAFIPYLSVQYMFIIGFTLLIVKTKLKRSDFHFKPIGFLVFFYLVEILNGFFSEKSIITNAIQLNTLALTLPAIWASFYKFSPTMINKIMDSVRLATIFLSGIVLVAHLQGKIDYGGVSSSEASNNLAPVQLSGYLGTGCILFLISILNPIDKRSKIIQGITFVLIVTLMILTFSRGGVYFVAIITLLYMLFNRTNFGAYFKFLIFLPIGFIVYNFVVNETGGKIINRYQAKGASNREELVLIGLYIFSENPVIGIGTGNYNTYIKKYRLFTVESGAHNEFIRVAAEHGIFGIIFYWGFFIALLVTILQRPKPAKEYGIYFLVLFFLITIHNGLKISIQPFVLMLAIAIVPIGIESKRIKNVSTKQ
jgi:O-antigen ligase